MSYTDGFLVVLVGVFGAALVFGVVIVLALMIGVVTPPVGMSLYIVCDITKLSFERVVRATLPYVVALVIALLLRAPDTPPIRAKLTRPSAQG